MPLRAAPEPDVHLIRQLLSFGIVGIAATFAHVSVAWLLIDATRLNPYFANSLGACVAFTISFLGNAGWTFQTDRSRWSSASRYAFVSLTSFMMTSAILAIIRFKEWPTYVYVLLVLAAVPATTFLLAKLWAFAPVGARK